MKRHGETAHDVYKHGDVRASSSGGKEVFTDIGWIGYVEAEWVYGSVSFEDGFAKLLLTPNPDDIKIKQEFITALQSL